ncbi:ATP-binding response regulator [Noviherbaspirillum malthae]|uniref:ATP-binding response regulator n=1 Tax=Noviherbaspirillum malthae TaxID=1260987 RepID=UPI00188DDAE4|nr:ATP-binding protein [Noviherbaspirillum malthae]
MKIRFYLLLMALAIAAPVAIFSAFALDSLMSSERKAALRALHEAADATALLVDRELSGAEAALRVLARSPHLAAGDMRNFYEHARTADRGEGGRTILFAPNGQQLINTVVPLGSSLPPPPTYVTARTQQVIRTQSTVISGLITGAVQQRFVTTINIPVPLDRGQRYVLASVFSTNYFQDLVVRRRLPEAWVISVIDGEGKIIARSSSPLDVVGQPANPAFVHKTAQSNYGYLRYTPSGGVEMYEAFTQSAMSGWKVSVSAPAELIDASAHKAVITMSLGLLVALSIALGAAVVFGRRLADSIGLAVRSAKELGHGKEPEPQRMGVKEVDDLHQALKSAGMVLAASEAERASLLKSERAARRIAEQQNKSKDEFLAMLGHELRNPLSGITGAIELMEIEGAREEHKTRAREILRRQAGHLTHIVDDLLDLARLSEGKIKLDFQAVDLGNAVQSSVATLRAAGRTHHALALEIESVWMKGDRTRLEQIITNLLTNAFKYTPNGGRITVRVYPEDDDAVLVVQDTGIGISAELMPRLFDIFIQGTVSLDRSEGGLGIGLALVRRLIELHHGTINAESPGQGQGSTFTVRFPRTVHVTSLNSGDCSTDGEQEMRCTILLIEDNEDARHVLAQNLVAKGMSILEAGDGRTGIAMALTNPVEAAIIDIGLPGLTGYEVARRLRSEARTSKMKLIALTGYGQDVDRTDALEAGFDVHLVKPVRFEQLIEEIGKLSR